MSLKEYFESTDGIGVLSTADADCNVDSAIYASPHFIEADAIALIMRPRQSYNNIQVNPKAAYLYVEKGPGYAGKRLTLKKTGEEADTQVVNQLRRKGHGCQDDQDQATLVYFKITGVRPLIGDGPET
ncbi:MAG: pyridoxamine 5'-phosphate oxidase family protein [Planctomycetota bacterium]|jgi:hypothetical protein